MNIIKVGETKQYKLKSNGSDVANVTYFSFNTDVATVDSNGNITGVAIGVVTIQATDTDNDYIKKENFVVRPATVGPIYDMIIEAIAAVVGMHFTKVTGGPAAVSQVTGSATNTRFINPVDIDVDQVTGIMYVADMGSTNVLAINPITGSSSVAFTSQGTFSQVSAIAINNGIAYYVSDQIYACDLSDPNGTHAVIGSTQGTTFDIYVANNRLYASVQSGTMESWSLSNIAGGSTQHTGFFDIQQFVVYGNYCFGITGGGSVVMKGFSGGLDESFNDVAIEGVSAIASNGSSIYVVTGDAINAGQLVVYLLESETLTATAYPGVGVDIYNDATSATTAAAFDQDYDLVITISHSDFAGIQKTNLQVS